MTLAEVRSQPHIAGMPVRLEQVGWSSPPLFNFRASRAELGARFGPPHQVDLDSNGLGAFDLWLFRFECGLELAIWQFQSDSLGQRVVDDVSVRDVEIHASDRELGHLAFHVGVAVDAVDHWAPDPTHVGPAHWTIMRQDDNGNRFVVGTCTSRCEAEATASRMTALGHRQLYWVDA